MKTITNWNIKRAGAGMTISGIDTETGQLTKASLIKVIDAPGTGAAKEQSSPVATSSAGFQYLLA